MFRVLAAVLIVCLCGFARGEGISLSHSGGDFHTIYVYPGTFTLSATGTFTGTATMIAEWWDSSGAHGGPYSASSGTLPLTKNSSWGSTWPSLMWYDGSAARIKVSLSEGGVTVATSYFTMTASGLSQADSSYTPVSSRPKFETAGGSARVWATRSGNVATIHVADVTLATEASAWAVQYQTSGGTIMKSGVAPADNPKDYTQDFDATGAPNGSAQYVRISETNSAGLVTDIFNGNVSIPDSATATTAPSVVSDGGVVTFGPGDPGSTTKPVGPVVSTGGTGGTGGGGGGTGTGSVVVTSMPAVSVSTMPGFFNGDAPTSRPSTAASGSAAGDGTISSIHSLKGAIQSKLSALNFDFTRFAPTDSVGDVPIPLNFGTVAGTSLEFTWHTVPDGSTSMGTVMNTARLVIRAILACFVVLWLVTKMVKRFEVIQ